MPDKHDIIYILKDDIATEELKYSLRSVVKNFPFNKVWFVGGQPKGLTPDGRIAHRQTGNNKAELIKSSLWRAIQCPEITDDFFVFNDDFFVMKPFKGEFINYIDGTLKRRIDELHTEQGMSPYCRALFKVEQELLIQHYTAFNFDVHLPILINKRLAEASINRVSSAQYRSAYGNINGLPYIVRPDVKEYSLDNVDKTTDFLSTNDNTFTDGAVGDYIRSRFKTPSRFED